MLTMKTIRTSLLSRTLLATAAVTLPVLAQAHPGHGLHGLSDGLAHPILGLDHLCGLLALGAVSARFRGAAAGVFAGAIAAALAGGILLGNVIGGFSGLEYALSLSLALVAVPLLWQRAGNLAVATAIGVVVAGVHAMAHGIELQGNAALLGFVLSSTFLLACGHALGRLLVAQPRVQAVLGAGVACFGLWSLLGA
ncbi:MAG: urease accessory protein [Puniceicoccaceae bacterium 5H]|nr:MAG: urease accessory protein [Puniceicoccaceae bacterium 5H]